MFMPHRLRVQNGWSLAAEVGFYTLVGVLLVALFARPAKSAPPAAVVQRTDAGPTCVGGTCSLGAATVAGRRTPAEAPGRYSPKADRAQPVRQMLRVFARRCR